MKKPKTKPAEREARSAPPSGSETVIYESQDAATDALPKCPRPKGGQPDHWWYIDHDNLGESPDYIPCVCGTCGQRMNLSADAEDYPAT